jgi:hypothetical protein
MHRFPGNGEATFHLRAYRDIFDISSKCVREKPIQLMTTVIANILTEQTSTDA